MNEALEEREFGSCTTILHQNWLQDLCDTYIVRYYPIILSDLADWSNAGAIQVSTQQRQRERAALRPGYSVYRS